MSVVHLIRRAWMVSNIMMIIVRRRRIALCTSAVIQIDRDRALEFVDRSVALVKSGGREWGLCVCGGIGVLACALGVDVLGPARVVVLCIIGRAAGGAGEEEAEGQWGVGGTHSR